MMLFSFRNKAIVNISTGEKIGTLASCDLRVDEVTGKIEAIMMPKSRLAGLFAREAGDFTEIPWEAIRKIGVDTIIVEI